ncbi:hypothetical protein CLIB1423_01S00958 [[Candida] railenensis]|uniref:Tag1-like fifth Ig-like domain-containing protein n=1 Tax=[Candida] railenensis TaxID=45579 RepID=A0A9P0VVJ5_9ASCO|nr:hypothetical protein CLIB1423_01S00958 [[Candida] railenensis]
MPEASSSLAPKGTTPKQPSNDETTPLLNHGTSGESSIITPAGSGGMGSGSGHETDATSYSSAPSLLYYRLRILGFTIITLTLICLLSYIVLSDLDSSMESVVTTNVDSIQLVGFSDRGIDCHIIGSVEINYDNIVNHPIQKGFLKFTSYWLVGSVVISPVDPIKLFIKPDNADDDEKNKEFFEFVEVFSPDFKIDVNNHGVTPIDMITSSKLNSTNFLKYTKYFLNKVSKFELNAKFHANFKTPIFTLNNYPINFYTFVDMDKDIDPQFEVKSITIAKDETDALVYNSEISVENDLPITFTLEPMDWVLSLKDEVSEYVDVTKLRSETIEIEPKTPISITVNGILGEMANAQGTIIELVQKYLADDPIDIYLSSATSSKLTDPPTRLPGWIIDIFKGLHFPLKLKHLPRPDSLIHHFQSSNLSVDSFVVGTGTDNSDLVVSSNFSILLDSSLFKVLDVDIQTFEADFAILFEEDEVVTGKSKSQHTVALSKLHSKELLANISMNSLTLSVANEKALNKVIKEFLAAETQVKLITNINRLDVDLQILPFLSSSQLKDLQTDGLPINLPLLEGDFTSSLISNYVKGISISNISLIQSTSTRLDLKLDVGMEIDKDFLLDFKISSINYNIYYQGKVLSSVLLSDIDNISSIINISAVKISIYHDTENEDELQDLLSRFISGNHSNVSLDLKDGLVKFDSNHNLDQIFSNIDIHNIKLPSFDFKRDDNDVNVMSPFLVDATIYILKSEIEITIYNPLTNCNILAEIVSAEATYEGSELGHIGRQHMDVTPGIFVSQRIPFKTNQGIGSDILKKALNNQLDIEIKAIFDVKLKGQEFEQLQLMFRGSGLKTSIKL